MGAHFRKKQVRGSRHRRRKPFELFQEYCTKTDLFGKLTDFFVGGTERHPNIKQAFDLSMYSLLIPIERLKRINPAYLEKLHKLGIKTIRDLFYHFPHRYEDFSQVTLIADLKAGERSTIQACITRIKNTPARWRRMIITEAMAQDASGSIKVVWFNQPYLVETLPIGTLANLSGKIVSDKHGLYISSPTQEKINKDQPEQRLHTGRLVPVYPETQGLTSRWLRNLVYSLLPHSLQIKDFLPYEIRRSQKVIDLGYALKQIHFPDSQEIIQKAKKRLSFDELFLIQLSVLKQKKTWDENLAVAIPFAKKTTQKFVESLPFKFTDAQKRSAWEIIQDLQKTKPMNRLLEGDVGSGKTVVAAMAILQAFLAKRQTALMAPTEILAQQHFNTFVDLLGQLGVGMALLTGGTVKISLAETGNKIKSLNPQKDKGYLLDLINKGEIDFVIGTHALIQDQIQFANLALVVIDEQHRFGVAQRARLQRYERSHCGQAALQQKIIQMPDGQPQTISHLLSMTATPIPRTLTLTIYGDLDISLLDEMPPGRQKIITKIVKPQDRPKAYEFIRQQVNKDNQVFVICPRIEKVADTKNTEEIDRKTVKKEYEKLSLEIFPDLRIAMVHGKLKSTEKEKILTEFKDHKIDILISTSVIEVGIDIPNATVMIIEGAERFGLAQLHQFRGRIGRGKNQSYCFLFTESPDRLNSDRLKALVTCQNGFELAEKDLAIRGPGEFGGTQQWGMPDLAMVSLTDMKLVRAVRQEAQWLIKNDPELTKYPELKERLREFQIIRHFE